MQKISNLGVGLSLLTLLTTACTKDLKHFCDQKKAPTVRVFATGLNNPRGLKFGPDGGLFVAEGGAGGTNATTDKQCMQVPGAGPYTGSPTGGRISRISASGVRTTITAKLPSSQTSPAIGSFVSGVADVAFVGNTLYAVLAGAGCSHGVPSLPNGIVKIGSGGSFSLIANLSAYQQAHPVAHPEEDDFEPDGTWYSMINVGGDFYALEPNHGELVRVTTSGSITRVIDISASQGHIVPTAMVYHDGAFFVGNLNVFPIAPGSSKVYRITADGNIAVWASGFNTILGLTFDDQGRLYVLESTVGELFPTPGKGKIVRINGNNSRETIVSGLTNPTGITWGPDGKLYVSNVGFGPTAIGGGEILQVDLNECSCDDLLGTN